MHTEWKSQLGQDEFVARMMQYKRGGTYVDIGAGDPIEISNTFALERNLGWSGVLCEKNPDLLAAIMRNRPGNIVHDDALTADWSTMFSKIADDIWIDYLSLDLEPPELTLSVLRSLPLDRFRFRIATVEHDLYRVGGHKRSVEMASIMYAAGYRFFDTVGVVSESGQHLPIEDWWIHSLSGIDAEVFKR